MLIEITYRARLLMRHWSETGSACLTQKDFSGEKERIFLINRTEHPRSVERVRYLCVGCDVTWGPPYQALVTNFLQIAGDEPRAIGQHKVTTATQATQHTIDFTWFGVRPTSTGD